MTAVGSLLRETWNVTLVAAPFVLLGLLCAGVLHVLLPRRAVERWMGEEGLLGIVVAALFGIPLPLCSCGVVPVAIALRRKGASRPATMSFLISTPESDVDAILLTYGMLGPVMAIVRPIASFLTALVAGVAAIAWPEADTGEANGVADMHGHDHLDESDVVGPRRFFAALRAYVVPHRRRDTAAPPAIHANAPRPPTAQRDEDRADFEHIIARIGRYAFVELADDIVFWLLIGLGLAGLFGAVLPSDLAAYGLGAGPLPMLIMLLIGIPLYVCASASTPIGAALIAKGVSPGAATVFLLAGPATNAAALVPLMRHFGVGFVRIYLISIALTTLACGLALDWLLAATGWHITATLTGGLGGVALVQWLSAAALVALIAWRLWAGAWRQGLLDLDRNAQAIAALAIACGGSRLAVWRWTPRRALLASLAAALALYALSGVRVIPADARGYGFVFGRLAWPDLAPGVHYVPPAPFGRCDLWRVDYARSTAVGFEPRFDAMIDRRTLPRRASNLWHSPMTAADTDPLTATYLTGDENLVEVSFTVQYRVADPTAFFYRIDKDRDVVRLYAEGAARAFVGTTNLDQLLTSARAELTRTVTAELQKRLADIGAGVEVVAVLIIDMHPPQEAVVAFRDVSSAREDRETAINVAATAQARAIPMARGDAAVTRADAEAAAATAGTVAAGQAEAFSARAAAFAAAPSLLGELLWFESAERVLPGRQKLIVPPGAAGDHLTLWRQSSPPTDASPQPAAPPVSRGGVPQEQQ